MIEPGKAELAAFDDGGPMPPRRAAVICLQRANNATYKGVVSLTDDRVESFEHIPGVQANFTVDEFLECDEMLRTHPDVHRGAGQARDHRYRPGLHGHLDLRRRGGTAGVPRPPARVVGHLGQGRARR